MKLGSVNFPTLIFFSIVLALQSLLILYIHFTISLSIYPKIILLGFLFELPVSIDQIGRTDILTLLSLFIHENEIALHLFRSFIFLLEFCSSPHIDLMHILLDLYLHILFLMLMKWHYVFNFKFQIFISDIYESNWLSYNNLISWNLDIFTN